jgi:site-specific DNA recombinase
MTSNPNRPLIPYLRQSRRKERTISIDEQRRDVRAWAKANGVRLAPEVVEQGVSGSKPWRERELGAAIAACESGQASGIIVAHLDRLSRENNLGTAEVWQALKAADARLVTCDGIDSAAEGSELLFDIRAAIAADAWRRYKGNWAKATRSAVERGVHLSGQTPTGYRRREDSRLEPDPVSGPVVTELFERRAAGASWPELAAFMDERLPRENGGRWIGRTLASLIRRRVFLGEASGNGNVNPHAHEPLVTKRVWLAAQQAKSVPRRRHQTLLAGLVVCGSCGYSMTRTANSPADGRRFVNYACSKKHAAGNCPAAAQISLPRADQYVEALFINWLRTEQIAADATPTGGEFESALARLEAAEAELHAYHDTGLASVVGVESFTAQVQKRQSAVDGARAELALVRPVPELNCKALLAMWDDLSVSERRGFLADALDAVVVKPGRGPADERCVAYWRGTSPELPSRQHPALVALG